MLHKIYININSNEIIYNINKSTLQIKNKFILE